MIKYRMSRFTIANFYDNGYWLYNSLYGIKGYAKENKYISQIEKLLDGELISSDEIYDELKSFCVDEDVDEVKLALAMYHYKDSIDKTLRLIIVTTNACNFRCRYCYEDHSDCLTIDDRFKCDLLNALSDYKTKYGLTNLIIEWYGGEPLMIYDKLVRYVTDINEWGKENDVICQHTATSNGYYLTKERYEELYKLGFVRFQITVDGFKQTHNKLRCSNDNDGDNWSVIVQNLREIKDADGNAVILLRANYSFELLSYLEEYVAFLCENFNSPKFQMFFYPIKRWGGENDSELDVLDDSLLLPASEIVLKTMTKYKLRSKFYIDRLKLFSQICYAGDQRSFFINTNGDIQKCSLIPDSAGKFNVIGTISDGRFDINEAYNFMFCTPGMNLMREKGCFDCAYLPICYGLCCPYAMVTKNEIRCIKEKMNMEALIEYDYKTK